MEPAASITGADRHIVPRPVRAAIVLLAAASFLAYVFEIFGSAFWTAGMGDWMDPYFINALLEHWHRSFWTLSDPSSPPMYFPARQPLGYSHGLVLYVPFYLPIRLLTHPFQAYNLTLFAVMLTGIVCLYLVFRRFFRLSFLEAFLLTAFFFTSPNVVNGPVGVWSQRASVFLIPPILLLLLVSRRLRDRRVGLVLAGASGFLATSMFTQDFYTAQFALFFLLCPVALVLFERRSACARALQTLWRERRRGEWAALAVLAIMAVWMLYLMNSGGVDVRIAGLRVSSRDWRRPAAIALVALAILVSLHDRSRVTAVLRSLSLWQLSFGAGAFVGCAMFLWIYLGAYQEHPTFPESDLLSQLVQRDPARWTSLLVFGRDLVPYDTVRPFALVIGTAILAWIPAFRVSASTRRYCLAASLVSILVLFMPLRFGEFSLWRAFFEPLPGFSVIRDPKRVVYLYELAVALAMGFLLTTTRRGSAYRTAVVLIMGVLLVTVRTRDVFVYSRPNQSYDRWVAAPIVIDGSCRSFFIGRASPEYAARSRDLRTLYNIDATFVALAVSIPTLNGYSAWAPTEWYLFNPEEKLYAERVRSWIDRHALTDVCELDVVARTIKPAY